MLVVHGTGSPDRCVCVAKKVAVNGSFTTRQSLDKDLGGDGEVASLLQRSNEQEQVISPLTREARKGSRILLSQK